MNFVQRKAILNEMNHSLHTILEKYNLEDVGIFQEEGEGDRYYLGYTVRKNGEIFMIHQEFTKNEEGDLASNEKTWIIESDDGDSRGYESLDAVFDYLNNGITH